jgi:hypothetical protein
MSDTISPTTANPVEADVREDLAIFQTWYPHDDPMILPAVHGGRLLQLGDRIHSEIESIGSMDVTMK